MTGWALVRYLGVDALRAGRWVAPVALFLVIVVAGTAVGDTALGCYGFTATVLFPIAVWVSIAVSSSEDPVQTAVTVVTVGSSLAVRVAKLTVAALAATLLAAFALLWPLITDHPARTVDILAGVAGHLLTALAGVTFGGLLSRPVLRTPTWSVLGGVTIVLAELLVPGVPPVRPIAVLFSHTTPAAAELTRTLAATAGETLVGAILLVGAAQVLASRRG